jgi:hypothetical protein
MRLASDYIHPTPYRGRCRVRIYVPDDASDAPVVICSEVPNNPGQSVTGAAERIAAEVIRKHPHLPTPLVWIEHRPPETTDGRTETFDLVVFGSSEVRERRAPYWGEGAPEIGEPTWKRLDRRTVEALVGGPV